jgi:hypothetical protein
VNLLSEFGRFISDRTEWIADRWNKTTGGQAELRFSGNNAHQQLANYLATLCQTLSKRLKQGEKTRRTEKRPLANTQPKHHWEPGYALDEIIRGLSQIRQVISVDCLNTFICERPEIDPSVMAKAEAVIHEFFSDLLAGSARQFALEKHN